MYAPVYAHGADISVLIAFTGLHQTDQTKPAVVTCPQQTGGHKQPVITGSCCGDLSMANQVSENSELIVLSSGV